jgi:hypothetical protein
VTVVASGRGLRLAGWLLTPAVVWAASFVGGWLGALLGARVGTPASGMVWLVGGSVIGGTGGLVLWIVRLKRGARLARPAVAEPNADR